MYVVLAVLLNITASCILWCVHWKIPQSSRTVSFSSAFQDHGTILRPPCIKNNRKSNPKDVAMLSLPNQDLWIACTLWTLTVYLHGCSGDWSVLAPWEHRCELAGKIAYNVNGVFNDHVIVSVKCTCDFFCSTYACSNVSTCNFDTQCHPCKHGPLTPLTPVQLLVIAARTCIYVYSLHHLHHLRLVRDRKVVQSVTNAVAFSTNFKRSLSLCVLTAQERLACKGCTTAKKYF